MKNAEIRIIRAELEHWPNKTTGEVKDMTKILYAIKKELDKNQKKLIVEGLDNLFIEYLNN